jgi:hypothetical protein
MQAKETIDEIRTELYTVDAKVDNLAKLPTEMQAGLKVLSSSKGLWGSGTCRPLSHIALFRTRSHQFFAPNSSRFNAPRLISKHAQ